MDEMADAPHQEGRGIECEHEWQITEIVLERTAADTLSRCVKCGGTGYQGGQGRRPRPALPKIERTLDEL